MRGATAGPSRSPSSASFGSGDSRHSAAIIFVCGLPEPSAWYASPVYPTAATSRSTRKPQAVSSGSDATSRATQSLIAGVPFMYFGERPRTKPMFWIASAVLT